MRRILERLQVRVAKAFRKLCTLQLPNVAKKVLDRSKSLTELPRATSIQRV